MMSVSVSLDFGTYYHYSVSVIRLWNLLPLQVKTSTNILEFKRLLIEYITAHV